jgi:hypothetical protein
MLEAITGSDNNLKQATGESECVCFSVIDPSYPHSCQLCKRKISACLYTTQLQHKITLQAAEINRLKDELSSSELEIRRQQSDLQMLNTKYVAGIEHIADVQSQKDQSDRELEELSTRLFEEANNMVADEKRKRMRLEQLLYATKSLLIDERNQLRELKHRMQAIASEPDVKYFSDDIGNTPTSDCRIIQVTEACKNSILDNTQDSQNVTMLAVETERVETSIQCVANAKQPVPVSENAVFDPELNQLKIFRAYIDRYSNILLSGKQSSGSSTPSSSFFDSEDEGLSLSSDDLSNCNYRKPPPTPQQSAYIEQCEKEDIEPCLQFGNPDSRMCTKVMMQCMLQTPCFIEAITIEQARLIPSPSKAISSAYYRPIWERWTASTHEEDTVLLECAGCGRKITTQKQITGARQLYRFRLDEQDDWLLVDPSCRNRLVAVCNFYSFVRNIQLGHYLNQSFNDLYLENIRLRKKIFESR